MADDRVTLSVVIAVLDAEEHLAHQLASIAAQQCSVPWEVVVADNGSSDRSVEIAEGFRSRLPSLTVLDASARRGPGAARNAGVAAARGDRLVFCDADDELAPGHLEAMAAALADHALVGAAIDHERLNPPGTGAIHTTQTGLLQTDPPFLPTPSVRRLGVQRSLHEQLGGFDPDVDIACEDRDYCYRAQLAGVELALVPEALVHYRHRSTWSGYYRQWRNYAIGSVQMFERYRDDGLGKPPALRALPGWAMTALLFLPSLRTRRRRLQWAARLGWRVGRARGSLRYRVWAP